MVLVKGGSTTRATSVVLCRVERESAVVRSPPIGPSGQPLNYTIHHSTLLYCTLLLTTVPV